MSTKQRIAVVVSGSIAAKKRTLETLDPLRKEGFDVTVILRRSVETWKWVSKDDLAALGYKVLSESGSPAEEIEKSLHAAQTILVSPASANFMAELAYGLSPLANYILSAKTGSKRRDGSRVIVAPAMNYVMWQRLTTQENCGALSKAGFRILGPIFGPQACHDEGYGRMIDVKELIAGTKAVAAGASDPSFYHYELARTEGMKPVPCRPPENDARILVVLGGMPVDWTSVTKLVGEINRTGRVADYVLDPLWASRQEELKSLTQQTVVTDYYQIPEFDGLEHIRLPERARSVFIPYIDNDLAKALSQGRAPTLALAIVLASKAPIVTTREALEHLPPAVALRLRQIGIDAIDQVSELAQYPAPVQSTSSAPG